MNFTLKQLQIFVSVVTTGSMLAASHELNISQPAVSSAITELETNLGAPLFDRWKKRIILNERGRALLPMAQLLLANAREVEMTFGSFEKRPGGTLRIGASMTLAGYVIPRIIAGFLNEFPLTRVELISSNRSNIISRVEDCTLDIGIIAGKSQKPHIYNRLCMTDELCVFARAGHPLACRSTVTPDDLANAEWIMREEGSGTLAAFLNVFPAELSRMKVIMECDNLESIKRGVESSDALGCISVNALRGDVAAGIFSILPTPYLNLRRECYTLIHEQRRGSMLLNAFHDRLSGAAYL